jgi:hypothetical protein
VWINFIRHPPDWRVVKTFHSPNKKATIPDQGRKNQGEGEKTLIRLASKFLFLLAQSEFLSHWASGIHTFAFQFIFFAVILTTLTSGNTRVFSSL